MKNIVPIRRTLKSRIRHLIKRRRLLLLVIGSCIGAILGGIIYWRVNIDPAGPGEPCIVTRIYDGDTMTLQCSGEKVKVRLHCIDTPELRQAPWGARSRDYLRDITGNKVTLQRLETDRYDRIVGTVMGYDGMNLNLEMVKDGYAAVYARYCEDSEFFDAQLAAKLAGVGIWRESGQHQRPWEWRQRRGREVDYLTIDKLNAEPGYAGEYDSFALSGVLDGGRRVIFAGDPEGSTHNIDALKSQRLPVTIALDLESCEWHDEYLFIPAKVVITVAPER